MILNRKNETNQRTIVERLRNVKFFMSSTVGGAEGYCNLVFCLSVYLSVYEQNSGELTTLGLRLSY